MSAIPEGDGAVGGCQADVAPLLSALTFGQALHTADQCVRQAAVRRGSNERIAARFGLCWVAVAHVWSDTLTKLRCTPLNRTPLNGWPVPSWKGAHGLTKINWATGEPCALLARRHVNPRVPKVPDERVEHLVPFHAPHSLPFDIHDFRFIAWTAAVPGPNWALTRPSGSGQPE